MTLKTLIVGLLSCAAVLGQSAAGSFAGSGSSAAAGSGPAVGTWSIIQHKMFSTSGSTGSGSCASGTATCTVNVTAIGAGHLLVCFAHGVSVSGVTSCSGDGDTWSECCTTTNGTLTIDLWWVISSTGGGTSISCNFASTSTYKECGLREYALSAGSPVSSSGGTFLQFGCTNCNGEALTLSGVNNLIVQSIFPTTSTTAVNPPYGNLDVSTNSPGGGMADSLNTTDGTATNLWTLSGSGNIAANALSFMTSFGLIATRPAPGPRARAPARRPARRAARRRRRRQEQREEKREERREDQK